MNSYGLSAGSSGGVSIDFSLESSGPVPKENVRLIRLCVLCNRNYLQSPLIMAKECPDCTRRLAEVQAQPIPPLVRERKRAETSTQREQREYYLRKREERIAYQMQRYRHRVTGPRNIAARVLNGTGAAQ